MCLKKGKSPDFEGIMAEHFQYAHPSLISITSRLFNLMLYSGYVPDAFGNSLTFPVPKKNNRTITASVDDFRPISICTLMSKIFEQSILLLINKYLTTSPRQFGFKKSTGCNHATHLLIENIDYFTRNGSTVSIGMLDLSKAFDKLSHFGLFISLLDRNVPRSIIAILVNWYAKVYCCVLWNGFHSEIVSLKSGVRQGEI